MRGLLDPEVTRHIEAGLSVKLRGQFINYQPTDEDILLDEIARIEREWGLV
jgi:hypothetical protein